MIFRPSKRDMLTPSSILTFSASAIISTRCIVLVESSGLNRNLEQREARGSMILFVVIVHVMSPRVLSILPRLCSPGHIVADETKSSDLRVRLHDPPQRALGVLGHRVGFVQDDQLEPLSERSSHTVPYDCFRSETVLSGLVSCNTTVADGTHENNTRVMAKPLICSLTTSIPRSSEALSSSTCERQAVGP